MVTAKCPPDWGREGLVTANRHGLRNMLVVLACVGLVTLSVAILLPNRSTSHRYTFEEFNALVTGKTPEEVRSILGREDALGVDGMGKPILVYFNRLNETYTRRHVQVNFSYMDGRAHTIRSMADDDLREAYPYMEKR